MAARHRFVDQEWRFVVKFILAELNERDLQLEFENLEKLLFGDRIGFDQNFAKLLAR